MPDGGRQVFGAVARSDTDIAALARRALQTMGRTSDTALTASTDGCPGPHAILAAAGAASPPTPDWFGPSLRLQHAKQAAEGLPADAPDQRQAKAAIVEQVERRRWRTRNGEVESASSPSSASAPSCLSSTASPTRKPRRALRAVAGYLRGRSAWLANHAERSGRLAGRGLDHGRQGELPGQPARGQVAADALVSTRGRPAAPGPPRRPQQRTRLGSRPAL